MPVGFELAADFDKFTVAVGESATFTVRMTAVTEGAYSGTLSIQQ